MGLTSSECTAESLNMHPLLFRALGLPRLQRERPSLFAHGAIWESALRHFEIQLTVESAVAPGDVAGRPLLVVGNHPYGLLDGVLLGHACAEVLGRRDFKFVANGIIAQVLPEMAEYVIAVDNMSRDAATRAAVNRPAIAQSRDHLGQGGALCILPAGSVSAFRARSPEGPLRVTDPDWKPTVLSLLAETGCDALPVHISGHNGLLFQLASLLGTTGKRLVSFRQFMKLRGQRIKLTIGALTPWAALEREAPEHRLRHLRKTLFALHA